MSHHIRLTKYLPHPGCQPIWVGRYQDQAIIALGKYARSAREDGIPGLSLDTHLSRRDFRRKPRSQIRQIERAWGRAGMPALKRQFRPLIERMFGSSHDYRFMLLPRIVEALFCITGTRVFAAYQDNPQRFLDNFRGANKLFGLTPKLRWRLIHLLYRMHWRKALKQAFPKVWPGVINEMPSLGSFLDHLQTKLHWQEQGPVSAHQTWSQYRQPLARLGITKPEWLNYSRRWTEKSRELLVYAQEIGRAIYEGAEIADLLALPKLPEPPEAARRHDLVVERIRRHAAKTRAEGNKQHRLNWASLQVPPNWRPLIENWDFTDEGRAMHHCVGSYSHDTGSLFAHIVLGEEQATLQWRWVGLGTEIVQVYGACNQPVSGQMRNHVAEVLRFFQQQKKAGAEMDGCRP